MMVPQRVYAAVLAFGILQIFENVLSTVESFAVNHQAIITGNNLKVETKAHQGRVTLVHSASRETNFDKAPTTVKKSQPKSAVTSILEPFVAAATIFAATTTTIAVPHENAFAAGEPAVIRGTQLTPLNSLTFQYRGADFGGLDASSITGPSITYKDFLDKLSAGDVTLVEFLAPSGDEAYATLKSSGERIRIGEGFPIEQYDGWSSPAFAIRSVKEKGVPYKFIVPGLEKYKQQ